MTSLLNSTRITFTNSPPNYIVLWLKLCIIQGVAAWSDRWDPAQEASCCQVHPRLPRRKQDADGHIAKLRARATEPAGENVKMASGHSTPTSMYLMAGESHTVTSVLRESASSSWRRHSLTHLSHRHTPLLGPRFYWELCLRSSSSLQHRAETRSNYARGLETTNERVVKKHEEEEEGKKRER